jgi:Na+-driven multidrug efflux pump
MSSRYLTINIFAVVAMILLRVHTGNYASFDQSEFSMIVMMMFIFGVLLDIHTELESDE